jgi:hypothetical protein
MGGDDHRCEWRDQVEHLKEDLGYAAQARDAAQQIIATQAETIRLRDEALANQGEQLAQIQATVEKLQRHVFRKRSEKMPTVATAIRDPDRAEAERILPCRRDARTPRRRGSLTDPHLPIDNNASERAPESPRWGARTSLFVGTDEARTWPASTAHRDLRSERDNPSATSPMCSSACRPTRPRGSTSCYRTTGSLRVLSRRPEPRSAANLAGEQGRLLHGERGEGDTCPRTHARLRTH